MTKAKRASKLVITLGTVNAQTKGSLGSKFVDENQQKRDIPMLGQD